MTPEVADLQERIHALENGLAAALSALAQLAVQPTSSGEDWPHHHELSFGPHERTHLLGLARTFAEKVPA